MFPGARSGSALGIVEVQHNWGTFVGSAALHPLAETLAFRINMLLGENQQAFRDVIEVRREIDLGEAGQVCVALWGTRVEELHRLVDRIAEAGGVNGYRRAACTHYEPLLERFRR